jgi:hypothetical protein
MIQNPTDTDKVISALTALAQKLGTTAEKLWPVLVQQQRLEAIVTACVLAIIFIIGSLILFKIRKEPWGDGKGDPTCPYGIWAIICIVVMSAAFIVTICCSQWMVTCILNPEYWALKDIAHMLR